MATSKKKARHFTEQQRKEHVAAYNALKSGKMAYLREHNLSPGLFQIWRKRCGKDLGVAEAQPRRRYGRKVEQLVQPAWDSLMAEHEREEGEASAFAASEASQIVCEHVVAAISNLFAEERLSNQQRWHVGTRLMEMARTLPEEA